MASLDAILRVTAQGDAAGLAPIRNGLLSIEAAGKRATGVMGSFGSAIGAATGGVVAFGAGIAAASVVAYSKNIIDAADNMRDLSQKTGVSVELLSKFQQQANMSGSNIEEVGKAMVKLGKNMYEAAQTGKGPAAEALKELGLSATDATGRLVPTGEQMLRISDKLSQLSDGGRKGKLAMDLMGKGMSNLVPALNEGRGAIEGLNASFDQKFADDADAYNDSVARLGETFQKLGVTLAKQFLPILQGTVNGLTDLGVGLRILNLPFAGDKAAEIRSIKQEIISLREERAKFGQRDQAQQSTPPEDDPVVKAVELSRQQQEAFNAAIDQSSAGYQTLLNTINATSQAVDLNQKLSSAANTAEMAINNTAVGILKIKLGQAKAEGEKMAIIGQIMKLELEGARLQKDAAAAQIKSEVTIADLKRRSAWAELRKADAALATAKAMSQGTNEEVKRIAEMERGLAIAKQTANSADREFVTAGKIADEKLRAADAQYGLLVYQTRAAAQSAEMQARSTNSQVEAIGATYLSNTNPSGGSVGGQQYRTTRTASGGSVTELIPAYAGGGYTGNGARSGGLDGRGGFMAMLHPRETVIDHTQQGGGPTITIQTGQVVQMPDGSQWVSMADLEQAMRATAAGVLGQLRTPAGRVALGGA